jgi:hypothetical protein
MITWWKNRKRRQLEHVSVIIAEECAAHRAHEIELNHEYPTGYAIRRIEILVSRRLPKRPIDLRERIATCLATRPR